ncbi:MAG: sigma-54-dependent Fis family transcriptional regulator [Phyllobacteriaceae bacterium]|nr:sigma-54-dependent Fis family transcriptional regulator [Phyllobacteriaceae bacterium]
MKKNPEFSLLLVDDEESWLRTLSLSLLSAAAIDNVQTCRDGRKVMSILEKEDVGLVLLDLTMPNLQGEEILQEIRARHPDIKVIIITGRNDVDAVVQCMKNGAFDYFIKIWGEDRLITGIRHAVQIVELERQNRRSGERLLERELDHPEAFASIVTASDAMGRIFRYIEAIAASREPVIVTGESGVGKEEIARAIHNVGGRGELVGVNMAGLNDSMLEDTLFGHKRGAFTNAQDERGGLVVRARDGTLFLDEIGEMSNPSQAKLLRFIQEGEYYPIGSDVPKKLSCRVVVATNRDLEAGLKDGSFRRDLFYRFAHRIHIPPLRERREDVPLLVAHFLRRSAEVFHRKPQTVSPAAMLMLSRYGWPGNVRELQKTILHTASLATDVLDVDDFLPMLDVEAIPDRNAPGAEDLLDLLLRLEEMPSFAEMKQIMTNAALIRSGGRQTAAAKILGISQPALSKRLKAERAED